MEAAAAPREGERWRKGEWMVAVPGSGEGRSDGALRRGCCFALLPVGRREGEKRSTHALAFTLTEGGREKKHAGAASHVWEGELESIILFSTSRYSLSITYSESTHTCMQNRRRRLDWTGEG